MDTFKRLIAEFEKSDKLQKRKLIKKLIDELQKLPDKRLVLKYSYIAVEMAEEDDNLKDMGMFQYNIGVTFWTKRNYDEARKYFELAVTTHKKAGNFIELSQAKMAIGVTHLNQGETRLAIDYLRKSAFHFIRSKQKRQTASNYNWLGLCYTKLNSTDTALKFYLKSMKIYEELKDRKGIALSLNSVGLIYHELDENALAEDSFRESLKIRRDINDKGGIADCLNNIGMLYSKTEFDKSLEYYHEALKIHRELGYKDRIANILNNIGNIHIIQENFEQINISYSESIKLREEMGDKNGLLNSLLNLAEAYIKFNKLDLAKQHLDKASSLVENNELLKSLDFYRIYAKYFQGIDKYKEALEYYQIYNKKHLEIFSENHSTKIAQLQAKYEIDKTQKENRIFQLENVELKNALNTIKTQNNELRNQSQEIELTSRILRHDISNNLAVINSAIRIYKKYPEDEKEMLNEIPRQVKKSIDLIQSLGKMQALIKESHKMENLQLSPILNKLITAYHGIDITFKGDATVWADLTLESVFDNLISNAIRHGKSNKIEINISTSTGKVIVNVCDFGIGIPDKVKDKIFDENFVYGRSGQTGLGLFIVRRSIQNFDGSVKVMDNHPKGSCFELTFKAGE